MADKPSLQPQAAAMYAGYPSSRVPYTNASNPYMNGQGKYNAGYGPSQLADAFTGLNLSGPYPLGATHGVKSSVSGSQGNMDLNGISRAGYGNNPLMVLPNGQTVPLSALYGPQQNPASDQAAQLQYLGPSMFPSFISGSNFLPSAVPSYNWPYGVPGPLPDLDPNHRGSWSSNDDNSPLTPAVGGTGYQEPYPHYTYSQVAASAIHQQYIAGPIQPMKCADNKS